MPQYSFASTAHWDVIQVTAQDDQGKQLSLQGNGLNRYSGVLTATEMVDSTPPTYDSLAFPVVAGPSRPYVYNGGSGGSSSYSFNADDAQSGFWKGVLTLAGPGGKTLSAGFSYVYSVPGQAGACGSATVFDDTSAACQPVVTILQQPATPAANPDGTYSVPVSMFSVASSCTVAGIAVLDSAGNLAVYGTEYGEPDLGIKLARVPDTTPPAATSASVSPASLPESPDPSDLTPG